MRTRDEFFSWAGHFSLGVDDESGRLYASFPVNSSAVTYEEYYELTDEQYRRFLADTALALAFVEECRRQEHDELLLEKPGWNRGVPV